LPELSFLNDPLHTRRSVDNLRVYKKEHLLGEDGYSRHAVIVEQKEREIASCIIFADGGATIIHERSAVILNDTCFLAAGAYVCALTIPTLDLLWRTQTDEATCFGIYHSPKHQCLISHGEISITRLDYSGWIAWSRSGRDIFSEGFTLNEDHAEAIDFNHTKYRFDLATGHGTIIS
jgi:hypothetical protein